MKTLQKSVLAMALLAVTSLPAMAVSVDIGVKGTVTPSACTPVLAGGGNIDYGTINAKDLSPDSYTVLAVKTIPLSITCNAPTMVAIKAINNRIGSNALGVENVAGTVSSPAELKLFGQAVSVPTAGLGMDGISKIGGYAIRFTPGARLDGANGVILRSVDDKNTWDRGAASASLYGDSSTAYITWKSDSIGTAPEAFTTLTADMDVQAFIEEANYLDLTKPITLDGSTTIELVYL